MTYDVNGLQVQFAGLLPLLDDNLDHATRNRHALFHQDYERLRIRHGNAQALAHLNEADAEEKPRAPYELFVAGAVVFIDLEDAAARLDGEARLQAQEKIAALYALYDENGFTARDELYGYPVKPRGTAVKNPS